MPRGRLSLDALGGLGVCRRDLKLEGYQPSVTLEPPALPLRKRVEDFLL